jgi:hypothetical protein
MPVIGGYKGIPITKESEIMLVIVRLDLTQTGEREPERVIEEVDYSFVHEDIIRAEIVDVIDPLKES